MNLARPHRHLCPEADYRDTLTDEEFWAHVFAQYTGNDMAPEPDWDFNAPMPTIPYGTAPCGLCGELGACGYDAEGRPMVHAFYDGQDAEEEVPPWVNR